MQDPFFFPASSLGETIKPLCDYLALRSLPSHIHEILFAFGVYHLIFEYIAPPLSNLFLSSRYSKLSYESKLRWNMHCASMVQSCMICVMALWTIFMDDERRNMNLEERMWGYTGAAGLVQALATGYFLFDLVVMVRYLDVFGYGMLAHASSCLITYTLGFVRFPSQGKCFTDYHSGRFSTITVVSLCFTNSLRHFSIFIGSSTNLV
jgi:hypothetical protein